MYKMTDREAMDTFTNPERMEEYAARAHPNFYVAGLERGSFTAKTIGLITGKEIGGKDYRSQVAELELPKKIDRGELDAFGTDDPRWFLSYYAFGQGEQAGFEQPMNRMEIKGLKL